jgi:hypothetical protein
MCWDRTWDEEGIGTGPVTNRALGLPRPEMNRALGLDLGHTKCWNWTWDKLGIVTGPEINRALVVTLTHVSYAIGPGMNKGWEHWT